MTTKRKTTLTNDGYLTMATVPINEHEVTLTILGEEETSKPEYVASVALWTRELETRLRAGYTPKRYREAA